MRILPWCRALVLSERPGCQRDRRTRPRCIPPRSTPPGQSWAGLASSSQVEIWTSECFSRANWALYWGRRGYVLCWSGSNWSTENPWQASDISQEREPCLDVFLNTKQTFVLIVKRQRRETQLSWIQYLHRLVWFIWGWAVLVHFIILIIITTKHQIIKK